MGRCPGPRTLIAEKRKSVKKRNVRPATPDSLKADSEEEILFQYYTEMINVSLKLDHIMKRAREMPKNNENDCDFGFSTESYDDSNGTIHPKK